MFGGLPPQYPALSSGFLLSLPSRLFPRSFSFAVARLSVCEFSFSFQRDGHGRGSDAGSAELDQSGLSTLPDAVEYERSNSHLHKHRGKFVFIIFFFFFFYNTQSYVLTVVY